MKQSIIDLNKEFQRIKSMGLIESKRKGATGIGYTFECLLNKQEESFDIPDYKGIEIKTKYIYSRGKIHLFCAAPDGDYLFENKRLVEKYGYPDKKYSNRHAFNGTINAKNYTQIGTHFLFKLDVNRKEEKIRLLVATKEYQIIDKEISWSFDLIKSRLNRKLQYLAIINAYKRIINKKEYFHYCKIDFYHLKDFDTFINLLEDGTVKISFCIGIDKYGIKKGKIHDHGTSFEIQEFDIKKLYNFIK